MVLQTTTHSPDVLLDVQGRLLSAALEKHARDFTLLFLHHTIEGTSLNGQTLIDGRLMGVQETPPLTVMPTPEEIEMYGQRRPTKAAIPAPPIDLQQHPEDMVERNFIRHHARLTNRGGLKEMVETQRQAMTLAAQHALDCAARQDQEGFNSAYRDIEAVICIGIKLIEPQLRDEGNLQQERQKFLADIHEHALAGAIHNRLASIADVKAEQKLYETYAEYAEAYQQAKQKPAQLDGPLHGSEQEPVNASDDPAKYVPKKSFTARVTRNGHGLIDEFDPAHPPSNDNERTR